MFGRKKIAIMGTGKIASIMADTIKSTKGVVCYAVGSRNQETANKQKGRIYGMPFKDRDIRFTVEGNRLTVVEVK